MQPLLLCQQYRTEEYTYLTLDSSKEPLGVKKYGIDGTLISSTTYPSMNFAKFISSELNREGSREERLNLFCQSLLEKLLEKRELYPPALQIALEQNLERVKQNKVDEALTSLTDCLLKDSNLQTVIAIIPLLNSTSIFFMSTAVEESLAILLQKLELVKGEIPQIVTLFKGYQKELQQFEKKIEKDSSKEQRENFTQLVEKISSTLQMISSKTENKELQETCEAIKLTAEWSLKAFLRLSGEENEAVYLDVVVMQEKLNDLLQLFRKEKIAENFSAAFKYNLVEARDEFAFDILQKLEDEGKWQIESANMMLESSPIDQKKLTFINSTFSSLKIALDRLVKLPLIAQGVNENLAKLKKLEKPIHAMREVFSKENSFFQNTLLSIFILTLLSKREKEAQRIGLMAASLFSFDSRYCRTIYEKLIDSDPTFWAAYWPLAEIYTDPSQKAHLMLRGACRAIQAKEFVQAQIFCEKSQKEPLKVPFVNELAFLELYAAQRKRELLVNRLTRYAENHCTNALFNANVPGEVSTESSFRVQWIKEEIYINQILLRLNLGALKVYSSLHKSYKELREIEPNRSIQKVILWSLRCMDSYLASGKSEEAESIRKELLEITNNLQDSVLLEWDSYPLFMKLAPSLQEQSKVKECTIAYFRAALVAFRREDAEGIATSLQKLQEVNPDLKLLDAQEKIVVKILQTNDNMQQAMQFMAKMGYTITFKKGVCLEGRGVLVEGIALDKFLRALKQIGSLQELNLANTALGDAHIVMLAKALQEHTKLEVLNLSNTMMGEQGLQALIPLFPKLPSLQMLKLSGNSIYDAGAEELAKGVKNLPTLQQLDLSDNYIGEKGVATLKQEVQNGSILQGLDRQSKQPKPVISFATTSPPNPPPFSFGKTHMLNSDPIALPFVPSKEPEKIPDVAPLIRSKLEFNGSGKSEEESSETIKEMVEKLKEQPLLGILTLTDFRFNVESIHLLANELKKLSRLKELYLTHNQINDIGMSLFVESLQSLTELEALDLSDNPLGDSGATCIALVLKNFRALKRLNLKSILLTRKGQNPLYKAIKELPALLSLNLSNNKVSYMPESLKVLQDLDLGNNELDWQLYKIGGMKALVTLHLNNNELNDSETETLANGFEKLPSLQTINLSYNKIGDSGLIQLSNILKKSTGLKYFDLSHNQFGDSGVIQLAQALPQLSTLITLNLADNQIQDVGANMLANRLGGLTSLETLDMRNNKISEAGKEKLLEAAKGLPKLRLYV